MSAPLHTPWSDEIVLIWRETVKDSSGFATAEDHRSDPPLLCDFVDGVSQSEFYNSRKAGMEASAQTELQTVDYDAFWPAGYSDDRFAELRGRRYRILRSFPQSFDTTTLILQEVIR